jgi:hypothetical protein
VGFWKTARTIALATALGAIGVFAFSQSAPVKHAQAAVAQWWQLGCYPYGNPDYGFGQYIGGWGYHLGEDVCHTAGTPVYAASDGIVMYSAQTSPSARWGNLIIIQHNNPDGSQAISLYGHLNTDRRVGAGQSVSKGERIGTVGPQNYDVNGGWEPHLHFAIHPGPYNANVGTYASWVTGYSNGCCNGWTAPRSYVNARIAPYDHVPYDVQGNGQLIGWDNGEVTVQFRVRNTGSWDWRKDGNSGTPVRLGTAWSQDRQSGFADNGNAAGWVGATRIKMDNDTPPGGLATFTATFRSNEVAGNYHECFSPVVEGVGWMTERLICADLAVDQPSLHYQWVGQTMTPSTVGQGVTYQDVTMRIKNTGFMSWPVNGDVKLGTDRPHDVVSPLYTPSGTGAWLSPTRLSAIDSNVTSPGKQTVDPGETAEFTARLTIPWYAAPGNYQFYVQPLKENITWFPENYGAHFPINITVPGYQEEFVHQEFVGGNPNNMPRGSTLTARLGIKNTGRETWLAGGANPVRVGTWNPRDRASGFNNLGTSDPWLSVTRASGIDGRVTSTSPWTVTPDSSIEPGEIAAFEIPIKAWPDPGTYKEYFNILSEGLTWFPDLGIHFPLTVTP